MRFNYFYFDPELYFQSPEEQRKKLLDVDLSFTEPRSKHFRKKFEAGDEEAIFEFVKESVFCFQYPWVTDQIEKWSIEGGQENREKLKRLFKCYIGDSRGRTSNLKEIVKRDQTIFCEIAKFKKKFPRKPLGEIVGMVASKLWPEDENLEKEETVWLVYKKYKRVSKHFFKYGEMELVDYIKSTTFDHILERANALSLSLDYRCSMCQGRIVLKSERKLDD